MRKKIGSAYVKTGGGGLGVPNWKDIRDRKKGNHDLKLKEKGGRGDRRMSFHLLTTNVDSKKMLWQS